MLRCCNCDIAERFIKEKFNIKASSRVALLIWKTSADHSSRISILRFFFENPKKRDFLRFFEAAFKKRKKRNPKIEVSDFADFSLHGISTTAQKQCMFIICMALVVA